METVSSGRVRAHRTANVRTASRGRLVRRPPVRALPGEGASLTEDIDDYDRPLCPLSVPEHESRYRSVDDSETRFLEFQKIFATPQSLHSRGHLFVVTGDRGYGKTSLRQRCAFWMHGKYNQPNCEIAVVDLSDENWEPDTIDQQVLSVRRWILSSLDDGRLDHDDLGRISTNSDIAGSFNELGIKLRTRGIAKGSPSPIVLLVLLPGYPSEEELKRYYSFAREGMIFMAEIFHPGTIQDITGKIKSRQDPFTRKAIDAHVLRLGTLKVGDDDLLMTWLQGDLQNCPALTNGEVRKKTNKLIQANKVSTSQFMKLLIGALKLAMEDQAVEVTNDHIYRFYETQLYSSAD
jgi:hypothetical protein